MTQQLPRNLDLDSLITTYDVRAELGMEGTSTLAPFWSIVHERKERIEANSAGDKAVSVIRED